MITREKNTQILISLLKAYGVRYVVASSGTTNVAFVGSIQGDSFFRVFSSVDERSAAYIACGIAAETGEAVAISCTGATASRNYLSGLTEAYYRKLPIIAITSTQAVFKVGQLIPQVIDRSSIQKDVARYSTTLPIVKDEDDVWECEIKINTAMHELRRQGGGPVHINLPTKYDPLFDISALPKYRIINRITIDDEHPKLNGTVAVIIGSHKNWTNELSKAVEKFSLANKAPIFCDHTSGYRGKNRILSSLAASQTMFDLPSLKPNILIHIGEVSGDASMRPIVGGEVWRVSDDGLIRDTYRKLRYVFEMNEKAFFDYYSNNKTTEPANYYNLFNSYSNQIRQDIPQVPLSNIWLASKMANRIPHGSTIHFGILNSLRSWNYFDLPESVSSYSNVGGFGIDGCVSSLIGASLTNPEKIFFGVVGDLAFFYDMNVIGNRHIGRNVRILLVNNGKGVEFDNYNHHGKLVLNEKVDLFVSGAGHFGSKSPTIVKHFSEDLGFNYFSAKTKEECLGIIPKFLNPSISDKSMIFEVFTDSIEESNALMLMQSIKSDNRGKAKNLIKKILGNKVTHQLKRIVKKKAI